MPIYDYQCISCGNTQDVMHKIKDTPEISCEVCDSTCKRIITSAPAVSVPFSQQSAPSLKYFGVTNPITGEGLKPHSDSYMASMKARRKKK